MQLAQCWCLLVPIGTFLADMIWCCLLMVVTDWLMVVSSWLVTTVAVSEKSVVISKLW